ncbi:MAG TPA: AAA family ATPase [Candidatus Dormibacteraeota bacterium]|nr:AAA family ATPase [Candidatus Dormibacteraeota bacterium]
MLRGREAECLRLDGLLDAARGGKSSTLLIQGEPGVGKSALLRYAMDRSTGMTIVVARGLESESELPFAGLADLVRPLGHALSSIPAVQAAILAGAVALGPPVGGDRFAVCAATLSLLAAAAESTPLLVVIDDIQWLDTGSAEAVLFAARRMSAEGALLLFAIREGEPNALDLSDLPLLQLSGLSEEDSFHLLADQTPAPVAPRVAAALHLATRGNPLALTEIPTLLTDAQRTGLEPLPDPVPSGPRLEHAFVRRVATLPVDTQRALLVAAANDSTDIGSVGRAIEQLDIAPQALDAAEGAGLIRVDGADVHFRHPLIRSAIYQSAAAVNRREAHRALARALDAEQDSDRRAWHLAAASTAPDESIASALEDAAARSQARSGYASAARALGRSASLSPSTSERARRLLAAANAYQLAGRPDEALRLLDEAIACRPPERMRFEIEHLRAVIEIWFRTPMAAHDRLLSEASRAQQRDPAAAAVLLAEATIPCFMAAELPRSLETARRARAIADQAGIPSPPLVDVVLAEAMVLSGMAVEAAPLIDECLHRVLVSGHEAAHEAQYLPFSLLAVERYADARALLAGAVSAARSASAVGVLPYALAILSELDFRTGNLAAAYAVGTESVRLARETGQGSSASYSLVTLARVEAAQGRDQDCRSHARAAIELARTHGLGSIFNYAGATLGLLELGRGRPMEALVHLEQTAKGFRESGPSEPNLIQWQPDYIESLARLGRTDDAMRALEAFERDAERTNRAWAKATAARCRGYLSLEGSAEHFRRAFELHEASPSPFEVARTQLCYGEVLRRQRQRVEARRVLREALNTFDRLGGEPWAGRAHNELSATGEKARRRDVAATRGLTSQEWQIALAVAQGATNREAAAQLFLSPRTVEAHLSSAYRKLGARSRTELVRIFANETAASEPSRLAVKA